MRYTMKSFLLSVLIILLSVLLVSFGNGRPSHAKAPVTGTIVFSQQVKDIEYTTDGGVYDLFMQTVTDGRTVRLTHSNAGRRLKLGGAVREPKISPDGGRVLFVSDYAGSTPEWRTTITGAAPYPYTLLNLWTLELRTRTVTPRTTGDLGWHDAVWSSDGRYFAAVIATRGGVIDSGMIPDKICVIDARTSKRVGTIHSTDEVTALLWSRDGKQILYQNWGDPNLYAASYRGGKSKVALRGQGERYHYRLSPDGKRIAFIQGKRAYVTALRDPKMFPVAASSDSGAAMCLPAWSRDGRRLAVVEALDGRWVNPIARIHIFDIVTRKHTIPVTIPQRVSGLWWTANGKHLVVRIMSGRDREGLLAVPAKGGPSVTLKAPSEVTKGLDWHEGK